MKRTITFLCFSFIFMLLACNIKENKRKKIIHLMKDSTRFSHFICTNADCITIDYYINLEKNEKKDILYYYQKLPPYILCNTLVNPASINYSNKLMSSDFYERKIIYKNIKNGFIKAMTCNKNATDNLSIALFKGDKDKNIICINSENFPEISILELDENYILLDNSKTNMWKDITKNFTKDVIKTNNISNVFFKLPEQGTTILACQDTAQTLSDPDKFWQNKLQNHPEEIIKIDWDAEKGKFFVKK